MTTWSLVVLFLLKTMKSLTMVGKKRASKKNCVEKGKKKIASKVSSVLINFCFAYVTLAYNLWVFEKNSCRKMLVGTFAVGVKQIELKIYEIKCWDASNLWALFEMFPVSGFPQNNKFKKIFVKFFHKQKFDDWDLDEKSSQ